MQCERGISIARPNGNGKTDRITIPCGKCANCLTSRRESWTIRLLEEAKTHLKMSFVTLTYSDEHLTIGEYAPSLVKKDAQLFMKRLRKRIRSPIRFYLVGEYGTTTFRPHYHILLFGVNYTDFKKIDLAWSKGNIKVGDINVKSITYVTKYHVNKSFLPAANVEPPFVLMSKGIGRNYVEKFKDYHYDNLERGFYQHFQYRKALPRYYKDKLYTRGQRSTMAHIQREKGMNLNEFDSFTEMQPDENFFSFKHYNEKAKNELFKVKLNQKNKL